MVIIMTQNGDVKTNGKVIHSHHSADDDLDIDFIISKMKEVGYRDSDGVLVLPKEYYNPADDIYDELYQ